jgi:hypothetical protein
MGMKEEIIKYILEQSGFNRSYDLERIIFNYDNLLRRLEVGKGLTKEYRQMLIDAIIILKDLS